MQDILTGLNIVIISVSFLIGLVLMISPRRTRQRTLFSLITAGTGVWVTANFFGSNTGDGIAQPLILIDFLSGLILAFLFWCFSKETRRKILDTNSKYSVLSVTIAASITLGVLILILSGYIVHVHYDESLVISEQPVYFLYPLTILSLALLGMKDLIVAQHRTRVSKDKTQIRLIFSGLVVAIVFIAVPNLILESILPKDTFLLLSYNSSYIGILFFLLISSYAIAKQGAFDVGYVVVRFLAYIISLGIIVLLFVFIAFNLTTILVGGEFISINLQIYFVLTAIFVSLLYGPIKEFVDRGTNRLFFQQSYSVHDAINKISSFSTRSVDAQSIQRHSLGVFDETIRPEYACFIVIDSNGGLKLATSRGSLQKESLELAGFLEKLSKIHQKITLAEDIRNSKSPLKEYFELSRIGVITRLSTNNKSIGYLVLGEKKNGNNYNQHDLQLLTIAANDLALALQNALAFEEIREFNATLQEKVSKATAALKRTNSKLIALDDSKDEFISMASHQLRTPLTSIKGYISMMLEGDLGKITPTQRKALEEAFNSSQRMVFLISDFLNVSRIRTGKFIMEKDETDLNQIVVEEITQLRELAGLRDQTINYTPPKNFPKVMLDDTKTRQVMMNFIDNAIFYTPKNGKIDIVLEQTDKEIIFKVTDTGIGVPKNVQHRLFTKFFRAENARNARPDGTGLGLFMGQKIIDAQGGKMIFHSVENEGSTFGFRFQAKNIKV